jgi:predicted acylesterase/phospholipase RssA
LANIADPTLPMVSLIAGRKGGQLLRVRIGDFQIEDLWLPFFCVSANISRGELHVHRSGSLAQALMASNAAPGIYPPVVHQGELLVDGALLDNVPVGTVAEELRGGKVIGVDVSPPVDLVANVDYGLGLSGWRVLLNRLNPFGPRLRVPSIVEILMRSVELGSIHRQRAAMAVASLYVRPPVEAFPLFDYRRGAEIAEVSYQAVRDPLRAWARTSLRRNGQVGA